MIEQRVSIVIETPCAQVWKYVSDMANWASSMPGYRSFEVLSERESLWTLKIGFGALVRTVKVRVHIELWREPHHVAFTYKLDGDPVDGDGCYSASVGENGNTSVELAIRINGQGRMAPAWEAMSRPVLPKMIKGFADRLKTKIEGLENPCVETPLVNTDATE